MNDIFIGISTANTRIEAALRKRGVTPVLLSSDTGNLAHLHGIVIPGNHYDVPPYFYGEDVHPETLIEQDHTRLNLEIELINYAYDNTLPLLAICGGAQLLNVVFGGSLTQHLPDNEGGHDHRQEQGSLHQASHSLTITSGSLLHRVGGAVDAALAVAG